MTHDGCEVAIVGAGPAGSSAAIHLAQQGARVVLYEALTYPAEKVCGEFLSPECAGLLEELGLAPEVQALRPPQIRRVLLTSPDGASWEGSLPGPGAGLSRYRLDAALAERAGELGVEVRQDTHVTGIEGDLRSGFHIRTRETGREVRACAVIAAHGKRSPLDRSLERPYIRREHPFMGLKTYYRSLPVPGRIELHGFPGGYCGISELAGGRTVVSTLVHELSFQQAVETVDESASPGSFLRWMKRQNPRLGARLAQGEREQGDPLAIAQVAFEEKGPTQGDILMAGDAAGMIAPLAGNGIAIALQSGRLTALHVARYLEGELAPWQLPDGYALAWRRQFRRRMRLARFLQAFMVRPGLLSPGLRILARLPALGRYFIENTRGL